LDEENLNYFSLMPTNLYGPNDNYNLFSSHAPAALIRKFHDAKVNGANEVRVWGTGAPRREFMHVDDMARACWYMLEQKIQDEIINVGTGSDIPIKGFAELVATVIGFAGNIVFDATKPDGVLRKLLSVEKIHSYGWKHQIPLEDGIKQTYDWYVDALKSGGVRGY
jgi:GDP-L-fucose synthase